MSSPPLDREMILHVIASWPRDEQVALAREIVCRVDDAATATTRAPFEDALGLLATPGQPAPTDEDIDRWRAEKYGDAS